MRNLALASLAIPLLALASSCGSSSSGQFDCLRDGQCNDKTGGVCEPIGFCAYPSSACVSGYQYSSNAGAGLANTCVTPADMGVHDAPPPDQPPPDQRLPDMTPIDMTPPEAPCVAPAPRLLSPLSTAIVTSQRPTLRWTYMPSPSVDAGPGLSGGMVQVCTDRACTSPVTASGFMPGGLVMATAGNQVTLPQLSAGTYFWHVMGHTTCFGSTPSSTWEFHVGYHSASHSDSYGSVPDFDGDGLADLAMAYFGAPTTCGGPNNLLDVYLSTSGTGPTGSPLIGQTDCWYDSVASLGDANGDGFADVGGANGYTGCNPTGVGVLGGMPPFAAKAVVLTPGSATSVNPAVIGGVGDVNGDGYGDFLWGYNASSSNTNVFLGSAAGIPMSAGGVPGCTNPVDSVAPLGDFNSDGYADAAVGTIPFSGAYICTGGAGGHGLAGAVKLASGNWVVPAGDLNGDGYLDLVTATCTNAAPGCGELSFRNNCSAVYVYLGGSFGSFPTSPTVTLAAIPSTNNVAGIASVGDLNGDGYSDVVVGAPVKTGAGGSAYIYFGQAGATFPTTPSQTINAPSSCTSTAACQFGTQVAILGDVNGDKLDDIAIVGDTAGTYIYFSNGSGVVSTPSATAPYGGRLAGIQ
jgi:hypothetical protein